jgi:hypothetical protein
VLRDEDITAVKSAPLALFKTIELLLNEAHLQVFCKTDLYFNTCFSFNAN